MPAACRRILLADADAFYVAVARRIDPDGAGRAPFLIVGGHPGSRGVVCSASYEARALGVRSAMPISRALRLCPQALCVPVPRVECSQLSRVIGRILLRYAPVAEAASIDEWYLDLSGTEALYRNEPLAETAQRMRLSVQSETGLAVSFGGGTNRLIAKLAVELAKPRPGTDTTGVFVVAPGDEGAFMRRLLLGDIPGVGPRFRQRLERAGLRTVQDVISMGQDGLSRSIGASEAAWLFARARGIDEHPVHGRERARSISREETFDHDIADDDALEAELLALGARVAADLRAQSLSSRTINVKLRDADYRTRRASRTLPSPVISDRVIYETARALLRKLRRARRVPARLLGIALTTLEAPGRETQLALISDPGVESETDRDRTLARTVDAVRAKFGRGAIGPGPLANRSRR